MAPNSVTNFTPYQSDDVHKHRRESSFRRQLTLIDLDEGEPVATVRFYGNGSRNYCCAWLGKSGAHARGSGWAGGYGYHKDSDAMERALTVAGFTFADHFGGTGESGEDSALAAIAQWFDLPRTVIVRAHP